MYKYRHTCHQQKFCSVSLSQDVDRLHREVNSLNSTVAAQGKEVERLQRENQILQGDIETHRLTVSSDSHTRYTVTAAVALTQA